MPTRSVIPSQLAIQQAIRELHRLEPEQRKKVVGPLARLYVRESGMRLDVVMINETGREPLLASLEHVLVIAIDLHRVARARPDATDRAVDIVIDRVAEFAADLNKSDRRRLQDAIRRVDRLCAM